MLFWVFLGIEITLIFLYLSYKPKRLTVLTKELMTSRSLGVINQSLFREDTKRILQEHVNRILDHYTAKFRLKDFELYSVQFGQFASREGHLVVQLDVLLHLTCSLSMDFKAFAGQVALNVQRISLQVRVNRDDKIFQCQNIILNYGIRGYINSGVKRRTYNETNFPMRCLKMYLTYVFKRGLKRRYPTEIITKWVDNLNLTQIKLLDKVFKMDEASESSEVRAAAKEAKKIKNLEKRKVKDDKKKQQKIQKLEKI